MSRVEIRFDPAYLRDELVLITTRPVVTTDPTPQPVYEVRIDLSSDPGFADEIAKVLAKYKRDEELRVLESRATMAAKRYEASLEAKDRAYERFETATDQAQARYNELKAANEALAAKKENA